MSRKLVIFDFDGTLADAKESLAHYIKDFSDKRGLPCDPEKVHFGYTNPLKYDMGWGISLEKQPEMVDDLVRYMRDNYHLKDEYRPRLFDGMTNVLKELSTTYDMAVITSRDRASLEAALDYHGIAHYFPHRRTACCSNERNYGHKPDPEVLHCLLHDSGHATHDLVMIGDTVADIGVANNANAKSIAVTWGLHTKERLVAENPTMIIDQVIDLPDAIRRLFSE